MSWLSFTRREADEIVIGPGATQPITIRVHRIDGEKVILSIQAEKQVRVDRREIWEKRQAAEAADPLPAEAADPLPAASPRGPAWTCIVCRGPCQPGETECDGCAVGGKPSAACPKLYRGHRSGTIAPAVWIEQAGVQSVLPSAIPIPTVFNWGAPGIGALELATAILADATGSMLLAKVHAPALRSEVISTLPLDSWTLAEGDVLAWVERRIRAAAAQAAHAACEV